MVSWVWKQYDLPHHQMSTHNGKFWSDSTVDHRLQNNEWGNIIPKNAPCPRDLEIYASVGKHRCFFPPFICQSTTYSHIYRLYIHTSKMSFVYVTYFDVNPPYFMSWSSNFKSKYWEWTLGSTLSPLHPINLACWHSLISGHFHDRDI